jgi:U3 small nucleolar ribonucleoprotein component
MERGVVMSSERITRETKLGRAIKRTSKQQRLRVVQREQLRARDLDVDQWCSRAEIDAHIYNLQMFDAMEPCP